MLYIVQRKDTIRMSRLSASLSDSRIRYIPSLLTSYDLRALEYIDAGHSVGKVGNFLERHAEDIANTSHHLTCLTVK